MQQVWNNCCPEWFPRSKMAKRVGFEPTVQINRTTAFETAFFAYFFLGLDHCCEEFAQLQIKMVASPGFEPTLCPRRDCFWCASALRAEGPLQAPALVNAIALRCSVFQWCQSLFDRADL